MKKRMGIFIFLLLILLPLSAHAGVDEEGIFGTPAIHHLLLSDTRGGEITSAALSGDGRYIAVAARGKGITFMTAEGDALWTYPLERSDDIDMTANGSHIVAAGDRVRLFSSEGDVIWASDTGCFAYSVSITPDGRILAAGMDDGTLLVRSAGETEGTIIASGKDAIAVSISPEAEYIAAGYESGECILYTASGRWGWDYLAGKKPLSSVGISSDAGVIAAISTNDDMLSVISHNGALLWKRAITRPSEVAVTPDGTHIATASDRIHVFGQRGDVITEIPGQWPFSAVDLSDEGTLLLACSGADLSLYELRDAPEKMEEGGAALNEEEEEAFMTPVSPSPKKEDENPESNPQKSPALFAFPVAASAIFAAFHLKKRRNAE